MVDFTAHGHHPDPSKEKCDMCGYKRKGLVSIFNPNVFPGNDDSNPEHFWDVCKTCKAFVERGMVESLTAAVLMERGVDADKATDIATGFTDAKEVKCDKCGSVRRWMKDRRSLVSDSPPCEGCESWLESRRKKRKARSHGR